MTFHVKRGWETWGEDLVFEILALEVHARNLFSTIYLCQNFMEYRSPNGTSTFLHSHA